MACIQQTYNKTYAAAKAKQGAAKAAAFRKAQAVKAKAEAKAAETKRQSKDFADEALDSVNAKADAMKEWVNKQ